MSSWARSLPSPVGDDRALPQMRLHGGGDLEQLVAAHLGHAKVDHQTIEVLAMQQLHCILGRLDGANVIAGALEADFQRTAYGMLVVDNQDTRRLRIFNHRARSPIRCFRPPAGTPAPPFEV